MRHDVTLTSAPVTKPFTAQDLQVGQYAVLHEDYCDKDQIVTKIFGGAIVSVVDPSLTWNSSSAGASGGITMAALRELLTEAGVL